MELYKQPESKVLDGGFHCEWSPVPQIKEANNQG
jgi:hypothetical protein